MSSLVEMQGELRDKKALKRKAEKILKELEVGEKASINTTDPECTKVKSIHGSHAGYNVQSVVDERYGLIVNADVVSENNDSNQFAKQINQADDTLGKECSVACGDAGYDNTEELKKIEGRGIKVIVPQQRHSSKKKDASFDKERFHYDKQRDCYICL